LPIDFSLSPELEEMRAQTRGYSQDTPLADMYQHARWARFADGADEVHRMRIAQRTIAAYKDEGSTRAATGNLLL
jgi:acyl-CoA dehydrogenase